MTVAREIQITIRTKGREHLITRSIHLRTHILYSCNTVAGEHSLPYIKTAHATRHIAHKIQPFAIGTHSRMGKAQQRVSRQYQFSRLSPCSIAAVTRHNLCIARVSSVSSTLSKIHSALVARETTHTLIKITVQSAIHHLRALPLPTFVFLSHENIASLSASNTTQFTSRRLVACRSEIQLIVVLTKEHRRIVCFVRVENVHSLNRISATFLLPFCRILCRDKTVLKQYIVRHRVLQRHKHLFSVLVFTLFQQLSAIRQHIVLISFLIPHRISICSRSPQVLVYLSIATRLLQRHLTTVVTFLSRNHPIRLLILVGSIIVFAHSKILLSLFQGVSHTTRAEQYYK